MNKCRRNKLVNRYLTHTNLDLQASSHACLFFRPSSFTLKRGRGEEGLGTKIYYHCIYDTHLYASFTLLLKSFGEIWLVKTTAGGTPVPVGSLIMLDFKTLTKLGSTLRNNRFWSGGISWEITISILPTFIQHGHDMFKQDPHQICLILSYKSYQLN